VATTASSLDQFAGFGQSPGAMLRDETIAYWEAFRREQFIQACMSEAGFEYAPAVAFPTADMLEIAESLGVHADGASPASSEPSPVSSNRTYEQGLSSPERERYNQTLIGESAADVAEADRTGVVPDGRAEDFATGGCFGAAEAAIPTVWDGQRGLSNELDAMRREIAGSAEMQETAGAYGDCVQAAVGVTASGPGDVEEMIADGGAGADAAAGAYDECAPIWAAGYEQAAAAAGHRFVERHAERLDAVARRYAGTMDEIVQDQDLVTYLAARVAQAT
jgi:hypothetical protein